MDQLKSILNQVKTKELEKKRKLIELETQSNLQNDSSSSTSSSSLTNACKDSVSVPKKYIQRKELFQVEELEYLEKLNLKKQRKEKEHENHFTSTSTSSSTDLLNSLDPHSSSTTDSKPIPSSSSTSNSLSTSFHIASSTHTKSPFLTHLQQRSSSPSSMSSLLLTDDLNLDKKIPANEDVIRRLRLHGQPIRLFGETDQQRLFRLHQWEANVEEGKGQRNEYAKQLAKTEAGLALAFLHPSSKEKENKKNKTVYKPHYDVSLLQRKLFAVNPDLTFILVYVYLRRLLDLWETELNHRSDSVKRSTVGKHEYTKFVQTKDNLKPFFKLLKRKAVENDVMEKIAEILGHVQQREYIKAYDAYLQLSIGNAPWPIGVTMVGIHERSAREKIFSNQVAHVLNDETQRKWIQSIKRIMTFSQQKFPPEDPTKLVG